MGLGIGGRGQYVVLEGLAWQSVGQVVPVLATQGKGVGIGGACVVGN